MRDFSLSPDSAAEPAIAFSHKAAKASWICGFVVIGVVMLGNRLGAPLLTGFVALAIMLAGLFAGLISLFGLARHGASKILAPALAGILINGLLVFIFFTNFMAARARAQEAGGRAAPTAASSRR